MVLARALYTCDDSRMTTANNENSAELAWRVEHGEDPWDITANLVTFLPIVATAETDDLRWELVLDAVGERLVCTRFTIERLDGGPAITSDLLRFPITRELYRIVKRAGLTPHVDAFAGGERPDELLSQGPTDLALRYVADIYQLAYACGLKPTKAVTDLGLSRSTAERWLRTARQKGIL